MRNAQKKVAVVGGVRIPFVKSQTAYAKATNQQMMTHVLERLVERFKLQGQQLGEVALGALIKHPNDRSLARESVLGTSLSPLTPAIDLQRACGTSLDATILVANKIALGQIDSGIAGGTDTNSQPPIMFRKSFVDVMMDFRRAKNIGQKLAALAHLRPESLLPDIPRAVEARTGMLMGDHCELMVKEWKIPRQEQDELSLRSHLNGAKAYDEGFYDDLVTEFLGNKRDLVLRGDTSLEKLLRLKPAFDTGPEGTLTAGNSSPLSDGSSAVLLASPEEAAKKGWEVQAYIQDAQVAAVDFVKGEGLLMAPTVAVSELLKRNNLKLQDFDFYEIHEAFAGQVLCTLKAWESDEYCRNRLGLSGALGSIDRSKMNVVGSSVALGHPFAATGARVVATLAKLLSQKKGARGLISICTAGGMGVAAILESPK